MPVFTFDFAAGPAEGVNSATWETVFTFTFPPLPLGPGHYVRRPAEGERPAGPWRPCTRARWSLCRPWDRMEYLFVEGVR
jgi:hypothetical protein